MLCVAGIVGLGTLPESPFPRPPADPGVTLATDYHAPWYLRLNCSAAHQARAHLNHGGCVLHSKDFTISPDGGRGAMVHPTPDWIHGWVRFGEALAGCHRWPYAPCEQETFVQELAGAAAACGVPVAALQVIVEADGTALTATLTTASCPRSAVLVRGLSHCCAARAVLLRHTMRLCWLAGVDRFG